MKEERGLKELYTGMKELSEVFCHFLFSGYTNTAVYWGTPECVCVCVCGGDGKRVWLFAASAVY